MVVYKRYDMSRDDGVDGFGYDGGDGGVSQSTVPVSVFNPVQPTPAKPKAPEYTQNTTKVDTSLTDTYFGENIKDIMGGEEESESFRDKYTPSKHPFESIMKNGAIKATSGAVVGYEYGNKIGGIKGGIAGATCFGALGLGDWFN